MQHTTLFQNREITACYAEFTNSIIIIETIAHNYIIFLFYRSKSPSGKKGIKQVHLHKHDADELGMAILGGQDELNHLAAILHVYAGGLNFLK